MTSLTWLDYSDTERRKLLDVVDLFRDRNTRDELGVGTVRDAFAELFSPGTSTIQARAKYFLIIPWLYRRLEAKGQVTDPWHEIGWAERRLIEVLLRSADSAGTIGSQARRNLKRIPSSIYWTGLEKWGLRLFPGSQDQYHRWLQAGGPRTAAPSRGEDEESEGRAGVVTWHSSLPAPPAEFPDQASLALTAEEAEYLTERIMSRCRGTLLEFLVVDGILGEFVSFPWEHPQAGDVPAHIREQLDHARCFSEVAHGAALLYNLMLAELSEADDLATEYRDKLDSWNAMLAPRASDLAAWDRSRFWEIAMSGESRIPLHTRHFLDRWLQLVIDGDPADTADSDEARQLLINREVALKGATNARLTNQRAREMWGGSAGTAQLSYRWGITQTYVRDILSARATNGHDA